MVPPEELFDVVDADDQVIRVLPRSEVHRLRLRHRAVHIFVWRADGCMLIHKRSADKEEFPGVWTSSASGHVASGESYAAAAHRELKEELGICGSLTPLHRVPACAETCHEFTELFGLVSDQQIRHDPTEIDELLWLPRNDIEAWMRRNPEEFSPAFRLLMQLYPHGHCLRPRGD